MKLTDLKKITTQTDSKKIPEIEINVQRISDVSYHKIAKWYDAHRSRDLFEKGWLDKAIEYLNQMQTFVIW